LLFLSSEVPAAGTIDCAKVDVTLNIAGEFDRQWCSGSTKGGYGGESPRVVRSRIDAEGSKSDMVIIYDRGDMNTYLERQTPRAILENGLDFDVPGSWQKADDSNDFDIAPFFGRFGSHQVACFAFTRYEGHVARSTGYQHRIFGFFCEKSSATQPLTSARIDGITTRIDGDFF
jgi:hypothetical protein